MVIVGVKDWSFKDASGKEISGTTLWLGNPIKENGSGYGNIDKVSCSAKAFGEYEPIFLDEVEVNYNKYGKVSSVRPL